MLLHLLQQIAQVSPVDLPNLPNQFWSIVAGAGFNGLVILILLWFGRMQMERNNKALDRNTRGMLIVILSLPQILEETRAQAREIRDEIDAAYKSKE